MFMASLKYSFLEKLEFYIKGTAFQIEQKNVYDEFPEYPFFICKIKK
ncbi:hypothetical protein PALA111701_15630 [Paenibacillus lactis]|nr:hypothetical protein [Paenibacillus lactis]GIO90112.1 hypothetical protein J31TS3_13390 [Paenibacillus lactis]